MISAALKVFEGKIDGKRERTISKRYGSFSITNIEQFASIILKNKNEKHAEDGLVKGDEYE